ncbi:MAG: CapA family protein [Clostridia bacterium]|nr:CapA family protein [Clostridia bacterium]
MIKIKKLKRFKKSGLVLLLLLFLAIITAVSACHDFSKEPDVPVVEPGPKADIVLSFAAVGDNLIHGPVYRGAKEAAGGESFDFEPSYRAVLPLIQGCELVCINQETPLGGTKLGLSSYPAFNSPQELGDFLHSVGFNLISHANNHILDKGSKGMRATLEYWQQYSNVAVAGAYLNEEAAESTHILEKQGVKVAFLAYTYGTNGISLPRDSEMEVALIDKDKIAYDVAKARVAADVVIVCMHWGNEYQTEPTAEQRELAQYLADLGVDIVVGSHPHVIQEMAVLTGVNGKQTLVVYSLGNFISSQNKKATMLGGMLKAEIIYSPDTGEIKVQNGRFVPLVTHYDAGYKKVRILPFADYTEELASKHGIKAKEPNFSKAYLQELLNSIVASEYLAMD